MKSVGVACALIVLAHCLYTSCALQLDPRDDSRAVQMEAGRVGLLEQRLRDDVIRELRDVDQLEEALSRNLGLVHEKKRQLEIKRSQPLRCLVNSEACL
jgi:hypothetical protein